MVTTKELHITVTIVAKRENTKKRSAKWFWEYDPEGPCKYVCKHNLIYTFIHTYVHSNSDLWPVHR